ncbi:MAG: hypothetical protein H0W62_05895 [Chitinophagales bacterium]|nr:hypothetical protein [Chitinophagales bacterium]
MSKKYKQKIRKVLPETQQEGIYEFKQYNRLSCKPNGYVRTIMGWVISDTYSDAYLSICYHYDPLMEHV